MAGYPRPCFDVVKKDMDDGTKPRHDEGARPAPNSIHLFPSKAFIAEGGQPSLAFPGVRSCEL